MMANKNFCRATKIVNIFNRIGLLFLRSLQGTRMRKLPLLLFPLVLLIVQCSPEIVTKEVLVTRIIKEVEESRVTVPVEVTRLVTVVHEKEVTRIVDRIVTATPQPTTSSGETATVTSLTPEPTSTVMPSNTSSPPTPEPSLPALQPSPETPLTAYRIVDARKISEDEYAMFLHADIQGLIPGYWYNLKASVPDSPLAIGYLLRGDSRLGTGEVGLVIDRLLCAGQFSTELVELELIGGLWPCPNNY
jgi:hypothetical protein